MNIFKSKSYLNFKSVYLKGSVDIIQNLFGRTRLNHYILSYVNKNSSWTKDLTTLKN